MNFEESHAKDASDISVPNLHGRALDDLMYTQSQESHCLTIRQQNPITKLWSLCEIHSFSSNDGARTSVWVQWNEVDVSYEVPTS